MQLRSNSKTETHRSASEQSVHGICYLCIQEDVRTRPGLSCIQSQALLLLHQSCDAHCIEMTALHLMRARNLCQHEIGHLLVITFIPVIKFDVGKHCASCHVLFSCRCHVQELTSSSECAADISECNYRLFWMSSTLLDVITVIPVIKTDVRKHHASCHLFFLCKCNV